MIDLKVLEKSLHILHMKYYNLVNDTSFVNLFLSSYTLIYTNVLKNIDCFTFKLTNDIFVIFMCNVK